MPAEESVGGDEGRATMSDRSVQFGRVPYDLVAGKHLCDLNRNELAFVLVVAAHTNSRTNSARISPKTIGEEGRMGERTAQRVQKRLSEKG